MLFLTDIFYGVLAMTETFCQILYIKDTDSV